jgi:ion channel-forming bestrophin family protein
LVDYDAKNWISVLFKLRGSVAPRLLPRTLAAAAIGELAWWLYSTRHFSTPTVAHQLLGVALGLLLVFRTNASFDRWWEGRKLLGVIVNRTRDLARQTTVYAPDDAHDVARLLNAFFVVAMQSLRNETDLGSTGDLLTKEERVELEPHATRPAIILMWITRRADALSRAGKLSEARLYAIDANLTALTDAYSSCERIVGTPVPFAYAQHIKIFVTLFCFTIPFAIVDVMNVWTPLTSAILAYALFGIDEIGVEIEDPFGHDPNDLPIDQIAEKIRKGMTEIGS